MSSDQQQSTSAAAPAAASSAPARALNEAEQYEKDKHEREQHRLQQHQQQHEQHEHDSDQQRVILAELGEMNEILSMCPKCEENGMTRLMITDVPFFKKVIVSSFQCDHCGERNTEITFGGEYGPKRTRHHLKVKCAEDMGRQVVKSEYATLRIPELELELPRETQKGSLNTVEGVLAHTIEGLQFEQPVRKVMQPEFAEKIDVFCAKLEEYRSGTIPFSLILDDPAGNSFIEPRYDYYHPTIDAQLQMFAFTRTEEERRQLGLPTKDSEDPDGDEDGGHEGHEVIAEGSSSEAKKKHNSGDDDDDTSKRKVVRLNNAPGGKGSKKEGIGASKYNTLRTAMEEQKVDDGEMAEIFEMLDNCPACGKESHIRMHPCNIPYFRETIIMAFKCDHCGYKSTEVQTGGAIPAKGRKVTLRVEDESDMKRDVLKSNTASLIVPELELELVAGTLGGFFTTIEGLLSQVHDNLQRTPTSEFTSYGDAAAAERLATVQAKPDHEERMQTSMGRWLGRLKEAIEGKVLPLTIILDDPLAAVYVQNPRAHLPPPQNEDPKLLVEEYERSYEQDEDLGLHQMDCDENRQ